MDLRLLHDCFKKHLGKNTAFGELMREESKKKAQMHLFDKLANFRGILERDMVGGNSFFVCEGMHTDLSGLAQRIQAEVKKVVEALEPQKMRILDSLICRLEAITKKDLASIVNFDEPDSQFSLLDPRDEAPTEGARFFIKRHEHYMRGRDGALRELQHFLQSEDSCKSCASLIHGEGGVGKSFLAESALSKLMKNPKFNEVNFFRVPASTEAGSIVCPSCSLEFLYDLIV
jgi:hypothetical protein